MARIFQREPIDAGDNGVWGNPELIQNRISLGINTFQLYDNAGTLTVPIGKCGLITSSIYGVAYNNAIETISLAAVSNGNWFKVEVQRSGTTFTFAASDTSTGVDTDPEIIPLGFDSAWDENKGGYYISTNYRTIAIGYKDGSGNLKAVINTYPSFEGYYGQVYVTDISVDILKVGTINKNYSYISIDSDTTIGDDPNIPYTIYLCDANTDGIIITLPTSADNENRIIEFIRTDSDNAVVKIVGEGAETISGLDWLFMTYQYQRFKLFCDGSNWIVLEGKHKFRTGMVSRSDWTNVHLGTIALDYDNLSGTFQVGEIVTGSITSDTGIIIFDSGSTLYLIMVTSGGVFQNNEEITGSWSGATADVDEASGSAKNLNCNFTHMQGINLIDYCHKIEFIVSSDGTYSNSLIPCNNTYTGGVSIYGWGYNQINTNNFKIQTGTEGFKEMQDDGSLAIYAANDVFYEIIFEREF